MKWGRRADEPATASAPDVEAVDVPVPRHQMADPGGMDWDAHSVIVRHAPIGAYAVNRARELRSFTPGATDITGWEPGEVLGQRAHNGDLSPILPDGSPVYGNPATGQSCPLLDTMSDRQPRDSFMYLRHRQGHRIPVKMRTRPLVDSHDRVYGAVEIFSAVANNPFTSSSARVRMDDGALDPTTGVASVTLVNHILTGVMPGIDTSATRFGLVHVNVHGVDDVREERGNAVADAVLRMCGQSIAHALRATDVPGRYGPDSFLVLVPLTNPSGVATVARRIRALIENSWIVHRTERVSVVASIGAAMAVTGEKPDALVRRVGALAAASEPNEVTIA